MEKQSKLSVFVNTLINILFIPVVILGLFSSILMFNAKQHNQMPSLFGYSSVVILTTSMEPDFKQGSNVLVKAVDTDSLVIGDVIAFYAYYKEKITPDDLAQYSQPASPSNPSNIPTTLLSFLGGGVSNYDQQEAANQASKVLFHEIVKIYNVLEDDGTYSRFFVTKGRNNPNPDQYAIKDSMVVGQYVEASLVANVFRFAGSPIGVALLVIIPCGLLLLLMSRSIIEQVAKYKEEKRKNEEQTKQMAAQYDKEFEETKKEENKNKVDIKIDRPEIKEESQAQKEKENSPQIEEKKVEEKPLEKKPVEEPKVEQKPVEESKADKKISAPKAPAKPKTPPKAPTKSETVKQAESKNDKAPKAPAKPSAPKAPAKPSAPKAPAKPSAPNAQPKAPAKASAPKAPPKAPPKKD